MPPKPKLSPAASPAGRSVKRVAKRKAATKRESRGQFAEAKRGHLNARLGDQIKLFRTKASMTLEDLALKSGVSRAMLSKVERGEKSPTLSIITRIARGLEVSLSTLIGAEPDPTEIVVVRKSQCLVFRDAETGFERHLLSPTHLHNGIELLLHKIPAGKTSGALPAYPTLTEKYVAVLKGRLTVVIGERSFVLDAGDALYFEVREAYQFRNEGGAECQYHLIIFRPR